MVTYENNEGAMRLANDPSGLVRSKHIDVRHNFSRNEVGEGRVIVLRIETKDSTDLLTKPRR